MVLAVAIVAMHIPASLSVGLALDRINVVTPCLGPRAIRWIMMLARLHARTGISFVSSFL